MVPSTSTQRFAGAKEIVGADLRGDEQDVQNGNGDPVVNEFDQRDFADKPALDDSAHERQDSRRGDNNGTTAAKDLGFGRVGVNFRDLTERSGDFHVFFACVDGVLHCKVFDQPVVQAFNEKWDGPERMLDRLFWFS